MERRKGRKKKTGGRKGGERSRERRKKETGGRKGGKGEKNYYRQEDSKSKSLEGEPRQGWPLCFKFENICI